MFSASSLTMGDVQEEISRFYEEPANAAIPIAKMYCLAIAVFKGISSEGLQQLLSSFRKASSTTFQ